MKDIENIEKIYFSLRDEITDLQKQDNTILSFTYLAFVAVLEIAYSCKSE